MKLGHSVDVPCEYSRWQTGVALSCARNSRLFEVGTDRKGESRERKRVRQKKREREKEKGKTGERE